MLRKKIKIFIVTYKSRSSLNNNIKTLLESDLMEHNSEINVINNHSDFYLNDQYADKVKVWHNILRPDFSTGHLARNWNQAIINGFKDLNNPDCDILVTSQDDVLFKKDCFSKLVKFHQKYSFIQSGAGDALCSYLPEAIKEIGLWDEKFCNIGYQEADYFLRALIYNKNKSMISDFHPGHNRILNNEDSFLKDNTLKKNGQIHYDLNSKSRVESSFISVPTLDSDKQADHSRSISYHAITYRLFKAKWGIEPGNWTENLINHPPKISKIKNFIFYPYFEKDVKDLEEKNYFTQQNKSFLKKTRDKIRKTTKKLLTKN